MTNSLARKNGDLARGEDAPAPWTPYRNLFGFDPFQMLRNNWAFEYDVSRTETGYQVEVPVPGYKPAQIDVTLREDVITVTGKGEKRNFSRSFTVPEDVDADHITARVAEGMLILVLERRPETQPKRIEIT